MRGNKMLSKEKLYKIYHSMKYRCYNKNSKDYKWYGAKGIRLCKEWLDNYNNFKEWSLNNGYKEGLSLDRINPNLDYSPTNCEWVTISENSIRMNKHYNGSPCLGRKLTKEHKQKCSKALKERYKKDPYYKLKIAHTRETNGNTKITTDDLKILKKLKEKGCSRDEMYNIIGRKVNRQYFNFIIRNL